MQFPSRIAVPSVFLIGLSFCICCSDNTSVSSKEAASGKAPSTPRIDAELSTDQLLELAEEKLDGEQYGEAIKLFTELIDRAPTATNYAMLGDCYWKQRELEKADFHYREALTVDPNHCGANHALGRDAVLLKKYQGAIVFLDKANEVCAGTAVHAQNLRFRVEALVQLDRVAEAELDMQKLMSDFPDDAKTYEAGILLAKKMGDEALVAEYQGELDSIATGNQ